MHVALWDAADASKVDKRCVKTMRPPPLLVPQGER
jgi:hypothetical protein